MMGFVIYALVFVLGLLVVVGLGTLWAEAGGKRPPPEDAELSDEETEEAAEEDEEPWERPGAVRLDCESHRGPTVLWLGRLSLWLIVGSLLVGILALLPVIPVAVVVLVMASRDEAKMRAGTMDPAGERLTAKGARYAKAALATIVFLVLALGGLVVALVAITNT